MDTSHLSSSFIHSVVSSLLRHCPVLFVEVRLTWGSSRSRLLRAQPTTAGQIMATPKKRRATTTTIAAEPTRTGDVLDVAGTARLLTVSVDTVYDLFASGELPGRKVGRKWITTRAAVLRWIEGSFAGDAAERAIATGDTQALVKALQSGKVKVKGGAA